MDYLKDVLRTKGALGPNDGKIFLKIIDNGDQFDLVMGTLQNEFDNELSIILKQYDYYNLNYIDLTDITNWIINPEEQSDKKFCFSSKTEREEAVIRWIKAHLFENVSIDDSNVYRASECNVTDPYNKRRFDQILSETTPCFIFNRCDVSVNISNAFIISTRSTLQGLERCIVYSVFESNIMCMEKCQAYKVFHSYLYSVSDTFISDVNLTYIDLLLQKSYVSRMNNYSYIGNITSGSDINKMDDVCWAFCSSGNVSCKDAHYVSIPNTFINRMRVNILDKYMKKAIYNSGRADFSYYGRSYNQYPTILSNDMYNDVRNKCGFMAKLLFSRKGER